MLRRLALLLIVVVALPLAACKSKRGSAGPNPISGSPRAQPVNGNYLTLVQHGMTKGQVRNLVGSPQSENTYKPWSFRLPGLYDNTRMRTDWYYEGRGTITFTETLQQGGVATVTDIEITPPRPGFQR